MRKKNMRLIDSSKGIELYYSPDKKGYYVFCGEVDWKQIMLEPLSKIPFDKFFKGKLIKE
ncbi:MAG TPA: hypothetical protein VI894_03500 [Candidatus Nanoarchaeia archaeon]|nr:hypothetical protein [Candidatus Nanoarchaeia archaeon]